MHRKIATLTAILAAVAALVTVAARQSPTTGTARAGTMVDSHRFVRRITNPWLPFRQGSEWVYRGIKDGVAQRDVVLVTRRTRTIIGVTCSAVSDIATHRGKVLERTTDWYAQDRAGNVWYLASEPLRIRTGRSTGLGPGWPGSRGRDPASS